MAEKKLQLRAKHKTGSQKKTSKDNRKVKIARHRNWNEVTVDDPSIQHMLIGRPRKIKDENELLTQFNAYLASCIEKTRKAKLIPVKTEGLDQDKINILDDEKGGKVKWKGGQTTITNNVISQFNEYLASCIEKTRKAKLIPVKTEQVGVDNENEEILDEIEEVIEKKWKGGKNKVTNNVISQFEIVDGQEWSKTPTIGGFLIFLGGLSYDTWDKYRDRPEFAETVKTIDNILETIWVDEASKWHINPSIAALVLNVRYNRIPKKEVDNNIKGSIFKETDFIDD